MNPKVAPAMLVFKIADYDANEVGESSMGAGGRNGRRSRGVNGGCGGCAHCGRWEKLGLRFAE